MSVGQLKAKVVAFFDEGKGICATAQKIISPKCFILLLKIGVTFPFCSVPSLTEIKKITLILFEITVIKQWCLS